jgi:peroxiredoxin
MSAESEAESSVALGMPAPDFELRDVEGKAVRLSQFRGRRNVVLVLTRGFF